MLPQLERSTVADDPAATAEPSRIPGWVSSLAIYVGSRVLTTGIFALVYLVASIAHWPFANFTTQPDFLKMMSAWDAKFYREIALHGYPTQLPLDAHGHVVPNAWAFLPVFPSIVRLLMNATGLTFSVAAIFVAVVCGGGAAVLLYRVVVPRVGNVAALWSVAFFCVGPMSFILQTAYAESLFLVLIFASLAAMIARRYLLMIPFGVIAAFTHPGALALPAALGILFVVRLIRREPFGWLDRIRMAAAAVTIAIAGFAWPFIASAATGYHNAYFDTEVAWWTGWIGRTAFVPFSPWFLLTSKYLGPAGVVLVLVAVVAFVFWLTRRSMRKLGDEVLTFSGGYVAYLFAVFLPQQSLWRMLLPLSPLLGAPVLTRSRRARGITLTALIASQPIAIAVLWFIFPP